MLAAAYDYPLLSLMWTLLVVFAWVTWFWLIITIFTDLYRRSDISGWGKAGWTVLVLVLPFVGVLFYLIAEGHEMAARRRGEFEEAQARFDDRIRAVSSRDEPVEKIAAAKDLLDSGAIDRVEYDTLKQRALSGRT